MTRLEYTRPPAPQQRLTKLTAKQEQRVAEWRDEWLKVGMSTERADRPRAEAAIHAMCARIGVDCPPIVWCNGPLTMVLTYWVLKRASLRASLRTSLDASLDASLRDSLDGSLGASLDASLDASLRASLDTSLGDSLRASLDGSLGASLDGSLVASLRDSLGASLDGSLRDSLDGSLDGSLRDLLDGRQIFREILWWWRWSFSGQHGLAWWAHYAYCRDELGVSVGEQQSADLDLWLEIGRSCGWWRPRAGIIWVCERPLVQSLDHDGRLHSAEGPAILCRDGYGVWAVHGTRVPRPVVEAPETLTVDQITGEENAEVRRVMLERFGVERYIRESDARLVDESEWGRLWRVDLDDDEPLVMVEVVNSTAEPDGSFKGYFLRVHPDIRPMSPDGSEGRPQKPTALNAVASTFGLTGGDYLDRLLVQT